MDLGRRNVLLLALCQAAFVSTQTLTATVGSLAGHALAPDKALATAPAAALVIGTALSTIPASLLMRRLGRRLGFIFGAGLAVAGGAVAAGALTLGSFALLAAGSALLGCSGAFAQQYRFAAAETSSTELRSRAISFVVAGGLVAGFIGPLLARGTKDLLVPEFLGSYACVPILAALSISLLLGLRMPASRQEASAEGHGRSLAMMAHDHDFADTAFVIQWHVVGMFLPGFFTGALIQRWGEQTVIRLGVALNIVAVAAGVADVAVLNFWIALTLNGIGWNFMFVAGSALVTKAYVLSERTRVQAANDFLVFGTAAVAALSSGQVLHRHGWHIVLGAAVVMLLIASAAAWWRLPRATWAAAATGRAAGS